MYTSASTANLIKNMKPGGVVNLTDLPPILSNKSRNRSFTNLNTYDVKSACENPYKDNTSIRRNASNSSVRSSLNVKSTTIKIKEFTESDRQDIINLSKPPPHKLFY